MGWICSSDMGGKKSIHNFGGKPLGKRSWGRRGDNIKELVSEDGSGSGSCSMEHSGITGIKSSGVTSRNLKKSFVS
jgi:hypothetical protein